QVLTASQRRRPRLLSAALDRSRGARPGAVGRNQPGVAGRLPVRRSGAILRAHRPRGPQERRMISALPEIRSVPVSAITILNPRVRNRRIFEELVASIANLGLKKPITVSPREDGGYDLICGQGRLEAFTALGQTEIPAVIAEATPEDCFV